MVGAPPLRKFVNSEGLDLSPFETYERALRRRVDRGKIPGYCSAVLHRGALLHVDAYGLADMERGLPYGPDVLVRLYCMTKPFVAAAVLLLYDRGQLDLWDPVAKHIPSFRQAKVVSRASAIQAVAPEKPPPPTIMHCLTHTAGLPYGTDFNQRPYSPETKSCHGLVQRVETGEVASLGQFVDALAALPLRARPGSHWHYSWGIDVLGRVVEAVSGLPLGRFLQQEVFGPLGMKDTAFSVPEAKASRLAAVYCNRESAMLLGARPGSLPRGKEALCRIDGARPEESRWMAGRCCPVESGGGIMGANMGGLVSTLNDSARFFGMLLGRGEFGGVRILRAETVEHFCFTDLLPACITSGIQQRAWGAPLGWTAIGEIGLPKSSKDATSDGKYNNFEVGEVGYGGAACTFWALNPARDTAILWFTQSLDNEPFVRDDESIYVAARLAVPPCAVRISRKRPASAQSRTAKRRRRARGNEGDAR